MTTRADDQDFDCLAYKDRAQARIYEETKGLSRAESREYFRRKVETGPFTEFCKDIPTRGGGLK